MWGMGASIPIVIVAKIESQEAVKRLGEVLQSSDGSWSVEEILAWSWPPKKSPCSRNCCGLPHSLTFRPLVSDPGPPK